MKWSDQPCSTGQGHPKRGKAERWPHTTGEEAGLQNVMRSPGWDSGTENTREKLVKASEVYSLIHSNEPAVAP